MKVIYLNHSGFFVDTGKTVLIFDYYTENGAMDLLNLKAYEGRDIYVFVSHSHPDHFDRKILSWSGVTFVFSKEIRCPKTDRTYFLTSGEQRKIGAIQVRTLRSTDSGVAFVVEVDGKRIYHAGDLNWWHWTGESEAYNQTMARAYQKEIDTLKGMEFDIAFVPLDPRLEDQYSWGLDYFMKTVSAKVVFPMHCWKQYSVIDRLLSDPCSAAYRDKIRKITEEGQTFVLEL